MKTTKTKMKNTLEGKTIFSHSCVHLAANRKLSSKPELFGQNSSCTLYTNGEFLEGS